MKNSTKFSNAFRWTVILTLLALVAEFVLGMYTALFVEFPDTLVEGNAWGWSMSQSPIIMAHILVGTLLVLLALVAAGLGFVSSSRAAFISSILGLLLMGAAYLSGGAFLSNVAQDNLSFSMALTFLGSLLAYFAALYYTREPLRQTV